MASSTSPGLKFNLLAVAASFPTLDAPSSSSILPRVFVRLRLSRYLRDMVPSSWSITCITLAGLLVSFSCGMLFSNILASLSVSRARLPPPKEVRAWVFSVSKAPSTCSRFASWGNATTGLIISLKALSPPDIWPVLPTRSGFSRTKERAWSIVLNRISKDSRPSVLSASSVLEMSALGPPMTFVMVYEGDSSPFPRLSAYLCSCWAEARLSAPPSAFSFLISCWILPILDETSMDARSNIAHASRFWSGVPVNTWVFTEARWSTGI